MIGKYILDVNDGNVHYRLVLERQITIITGNSGTGKTSFYNLIYDRVFRDNKGISIESDVEVVPLALPPKNWERVLNPYDNSIIIIDETSLAIHSKEFDAYVNGNNNYYILITRNPLTNLSYSVKSVFKLDSEKSEITNLWEYKLDNLYEFGTRRILKSTTDIVTEDSGTGYEFFSRLAGDYISVDSLDGAGNAYNYIKSSHIDKSYLIVVDGSNFGRYMKKCYEKLEYIDNIRIWAPESFEYLLLSSGCLNSILSNVAELKSVLENTYDYVDTTEFLTWERFFTHYLVQATKDIRGWNYPASKSSLPNGYKSEKFISAFKERYKNILKLE